MTTSRRRWICIAVVSLLVAGDSYRLRAADVSTNGTCAVMTLEAKAGLAQEEASFLSDRFEIEMRKLGAFTMVSRDNMTRILEAQRYSTTCGGTECAVEVGRLLAIQYVVFGSIGRLGQTYSVNVSLANVESGAVERRASYDVRGDVDLLLTVGMENAARQLLGLGVRSVSDHVMATNKPTLSNMRKHGPRGIPGSPHW